MLSYIAQYRVDLLPHTVVHNEPGLMFSHIMQQCVIICATRAPLKRRRIGRRNLKLHLGDATPDDFQNPSMLPILFVPLWQLRLEFPRTTIARGEENWDL